MLVFDVGIIPLKNKLPDNHKTWRTWPRDCSLAQSMLMEGFLK